MRDVTIDGKPTVKLRCPKCGVWGEIDDDQYEGRVSVYHDGCDFHETHNFRELRDKKVPPWMSDDGERVRPL